MKKIAAVLMLVAIAGCSSMGMGMGSSGGSGMSRMGSGMGASGPSVNQSPVLDAKGDLSIYHGG